MFYDEDLGFFSAILACYNNHWVLRTSPDDWWNVIVRVVAQAVDENGDKERVRSLFVDHEGKKDITIIVPHLGTVDYSWLFDQFSKGLREGCKIRNLSFFGRFPNLSESIVYTSLLNPLRQVSVNFSFGVKPLFKEKLTICYK